MAFKKYNYKGYKPEMRKLFHERLVLRDKIRYHQKKIDSFEEKIVKNNQTISEIKSGELQEVEKKINEILKKTGN